MTIIKALGINGVCDFKTEVVFIGIIIIIYLKMVESNETTIVDRYQSQVVGVIP